MSGGIFEFAALNCSQSVEAIDIALLGGEGSGESVGACEGEGGGRGGLPWRRSSEGGGYD